MEVLLFGEAVKSEVIEAQLRRFEHALELVTDLWNKQLEGQSDHSCGKLKACRSYPRARHWL
jgi:hypothetical protein